MLKINNVSGFASIICSLKSAKKKKKSRVFMMVIVGNANGIESNGSYRTNNCCAISNRRSGFSAKRAKLAMEPVVYVWIRGCIVSEANK